MKQPVLETERLILRELLPQDDQGMFELDSNPEVHRYLGNNPIQSIEQSRETIEFVRKQYEDCGIGRWALIEKSSGSFIGWGGLKLIRDTINGESNFLDVGYRLIPRFWSKGYATESARASVKYGFEELMTPRIVGIAHYQNKASRHALEKTGLQYKCTFHFDLWNIDCDWLEIQNPNT